MGYVLRGQGHFDIPISCASRLYSSNTYRNILVTIIVKVAYINTANLSRNICYRDGRCRGRSERTIAISKKYRNSSTLTKPYY